MMARESSYAPTSEARRPLMSSARRRVSSPVRPQGRESEPDSPETPGRVLLTVQEKLERSEKGRQRAELELKQVSLSYAEMERSLHNNRALMARLLAERNARCEPQEAQAMEADLMAGQEWRILLQLQEFDEAQQRREAKADREQLATALASSQARLREREAVLKATRQELVEQKFAVQDLQRRVLEVEGMCQTYRQSLRHSQDRLDQLVDTQDDLLLTVKTGRSEMHELLQEHQRVLQWVSELGQLLDAERSQVASLKMRCSVEQRTKEQALRRLQSAQDWSTKLRETLEQLQGQRVALVGASQGEAAHVVPDDGGEEVTPSQAPRG